MNYSREQANSKAGDWQQTVIQLCKEPGSLVECLQCRAASCLGASWHLENLQTREAIIQLRCEQCKHEVEVRAILPNGVMPCWPLDQFSFMEKAIEEESRAIEAKIQQHVQAMPAAQFTTHALWNEANWSATTYKWHPTSDAPPVMGLVFENAEAGLQIFRDAERQMNHEDRFEEIRIAIIEGEVMGQERASGYSVHLCADPEALCGHATMAEFVVDPTVIPFLGQWNRHYPVAGTPPMLPRFKQEFAKHQEFLLAPAVTQPDGERYIVYELGIVKNILLFRDLKEITSAEDIDVMAQLMPELVTPPSYQRNA